MHGCGPVQTTYQQPYVDWLKSKTYLHVSIKLDDRNFTALETHSWMLLWKWEKAIVFSVSQVRLYNVKLSLVNCCLIQFRASAELAYWHSNAASYGFQTSLFRRNERIVRNGIRGRNAFLLRRFTWNCSGQGYVYGIQSKQDATLTLLPRMATQATEDAWGTFVVTVVRQILPAHNSDMQWRRVTQRYH